jgi:hypothetical protein
MIQLYPEQPSGVLYDAEGRIVFRFAGLDTSRPIGIPTFVDPSQGVTYVDTMRPGNEAGMAIEAGPDPGLPDRAPPDNQAALARNTDGFSTTNHDTNA